MSGTSQLRDVLDICGRSVISSGRDQADMTRGDSRRCRVSWRWGAEATTHPLMKTCVPAGAEGRSHQRRAERFKEEGNIHHSSPVSAVSFWTSEASGQSWINHVESEKNPLKTQLRNRPVTKRDLKQTRTIKC